MHFTPRTQAIILLVCFTICALLLSTWPAHANGKQVDFLISGLYDTNGDLLTGGLVYSYEAGTTTPKPLYSAVDLSASHTNPLVLDAYGRALAYATGTYKLVVKTSAGVTLFTADNLDYTSTSSAGAVNPFGTTLYQQTVNASDVVSLAATIGTLNVTSAAATTLSATNFSIAGGGSFDANAVRLTDIGTPTATTDATTKAYVDALATTTITNVRTGTWTSDLNMGGYKITNLATPTVATGGANKGYVDSAISSAVGAISSGGTYNKQIITAGTTAWTGRSSVVYVTAVAGGGGGASADAAGIGAHSGAGGGGGGCVHRLAVSIASGTSYTFVVGAGGAGGASGAKNNGTAGANTTMSEGATAILTLGGGGAGAACSVSATTQASGGAAGAVTINASYSSDSNAAVPSTSGRDAIICIDTTYGFVEGGDGGGTFFGSGGKAGKRGAGGAAAGTAGTSYGTGGGGALALGGVSYTAAGGAGAPGIVILEWYE